MALVSASLLALAEVLSAAFFNVRVPDGVGEGAHASASLEVRHCLVDGGLVVAEDTDGEQRREVAEIPLIHLLVIQRCYTYIYVDIYARVCVLKNRVMLTFAQ